MFEDKGYTYIGRAYGIDPKTGGLYRSLPMFVGYDFNKDKLCRRLSKKPGVKLVEIQNRQTKEVVKTWEAWYTK